MQTKAKDPRSNLDNYEPIILHGAAMIEHYWPAAEPLLQRCIDKAMHGEMTVKDIKELVLSNRFHAIVLKSDKFDKPDVKMMLVLEAVVYPRFTSLNVVAIAGTNLRTLIKRYWKFICGWAYTMGVKHIDCSVSPAMERILQSVGFKRTYIKMRLPLGGEQ